MLASPVPRVAHLDTDAVWSTPFGVVVAAVGVFIGLLVLEDLYVKHGGLRARQLRLPLAALMVLALGAAAAPLPSSAQSSVGPMGLPDLISDPPFIWIERDLDDIDGNLLHVLSFDGFLHNIGTGALDLQGNPQVEGGVKQRVWDGERWEDVGSPLVRFETNDGHNHFHLINAAEYTLWNEGRTEQVEIGSKIGFCLLDTFQVERGVEATYLLDEIRYCNVDEPDSTNLRMGISPGWVDVYEASVTLQWVDVSNTPPGRYWIGAVIDPNNEIVESNEENNGLTFSANKYAVSGYVARPLPPQTQPEITLKSTIYGTVGQVAYVIVDPPAHGTLSVPTGFDLLEPTISYTPAPGYRGPDSFSYYAHDTNTPFPFDAEIVTVQIEVDDVADWESTDATATEGILAEGTIVAPSDRISAERYDRMALAMSIDGIDDTSAVRWFAKGLPSGLTIDPQTGMIEGELTVPAETTSTIIARMGAVEIEYSLEWIVADRPRATLRSINDFSTALERRDILVGAGSVGTTYEATGLPAGVVLTENQPSILGVPTEIGDFDVVVNELLDGAIVDTVSFTMTVRPAARPEFAL